MNTSKNLALIELGEPHKIMGEVFPDRPPDEYSAWTCLEYVEDFCRTIAPIVDRIIVVVSPGKREVLRWLAERWKIIPGLKTNGFIGEGGFEYVDLWKDLVAIATMAAETCKSDTVYLDNERTLRPWWNNEVHYDTVAVSQAVRLSVGASSLKFLCYQPHILCDTPERQVRSTTLTKAVVAGMKPTDRLCPGFLSSVAAPYGRTNDREALLMIGARYTEQLLIRPHLHTPQSITQLPNHFENDILNFAAATGLADARELVRLQTQTPQQQETETMHTVKRLNYQNALQFRRFATSGVGPVPASRDLPALLWANATNNGGAVPPEPDIPPVRQIGNVVRCRLMFPTHEQFGGQPLPPYWAIPEVGVGTDATTHTLFGIQDAEQFACAAADFPEELGPPTVAKRTFMEPFKVETNMMGVWMDIDVPLLPGYAFGVVNFHLARVIG